MTAGEKSFQNHIRLIVYIFHLIWQLKMHSTESQNGGTTWFEGLIFAKVHISERVWLIFINWSMKACQSREICSHLLCYPAHGEQPRGNGSWAEKNLSRQLEDLQTWDHQVYGSHFVQNQLRMHLHLWASKIGGKPSWEEKQIWEHGFEKGHVMVRSAQIISVEFKVRSKAMPDRRGRAFSVAAEHSYDGSELGWQFSTELLLVDTNVGKSHWKQALTAKDNLEVEFHRAEGRPHKTR